MSYKMYIGTYTSLGGEGIYRGTLDEKAGALQITGEPIFTENPSYLALHPSGRFLYCVNEIEGGMVSSFALESETNVLEFKSSQSSEGTHPCHLSLDPLAPFVYVANYGSGSVAALPILADGTLGQATGKMQHQGSSVVLDRQGGPHAHFIWPGHNNQVLAVDLGIDKVMIHKLNQGDGSLQTHGFVEMSAGAGPRHLALHPGLPFVYVVNELNSTIAIFAYDSELGKLIEVEAVSTLPADFHGSNTGAHILVHPSGRFLYASNRGHNSIAIFRIDEQTGHLTLLGHESTQGDSPRNFAMDPKGDWLVAANQISNNLASFRINQATGLLTPTGYNISLPAPVCVVIF